MAPWQLRTLSLLLQMGVFLTAQSRQAAHRGAQQVNLLDSEDHRQAAESWSRIKMQKNVDTHTKLRAVKLAQHDATMQQTSKDMQEKGLSGAVQTVKELSEKAGVPNPPKVHKGEDAKGIYSSFYRRELRAKQAKKAPTSNESFMKGMLEKNQKQVAMARAYNHRHGLIERYSHKHSPHGELGEGMGMPDAEKKKLAETIEKAQEKTTKGIDKLNSQGDAEVQKQQRAMKEKIQKADLARTESVRKADDLVDDGPNEFELKYAKAAAVAKEKWDAQREKGAKWLRELQSKVGTKKQDKVAYWTAKISSAQAEITKIEESQKQFYLKQVATFDQERSKKLADARSVYEQEHEKLKALTIQAQDNFESQSHTLKLKFQRLIQDAEKRKKESLLKLKKLEAEAIAVAKKRVQKATEKMDADIASAKDDGKVQIAKAMSTLTDAKSAEEERQSEKQLLNKFEGEFKSKLSKLHLEKKQQETRIKEKMGMELDSIEHRMQNVDAEAEKRVAETLSNETAEEEKRKEQQLTWIEKARRNAHQNCLDARDAAEMKASAAKFAAHRIARDAQTQLVIAKNHLLDAEDEASKLRKKREKRGEKLKQTTVDVAVEMAKKLYQGPKAGDAPCAEAFSMDPGDANPSKIPDEGMLDQASEDYAKSYIPEDQQEAVVQKREKLRQKAHEMAMKKTRIWAHNHALKVAEDANAEAEKQCSESQKWFGDAETTAKSRMGELGDDSAQAKKKAEEQAKAWATAETEKLHAEKKNTTTAQDTAIAAIQKEIGDQETAIKMDASTHMNEYKHKISEYTAKHQQLHSEGKLNLKLANENIHSRIKEAEKLHDVAISEAEKMESKAEARNQQQRLDIGADAQRDIDEFKAKLVTGTQQLKGSSGGAVEESEMGSQQARLAKQKESLEAEAEKDYQQKATEAKRQADSRIVSAKATSKQQISKYQMEMKQDISTLDERIQKAILKEKQAQQKVDAHRKEEKEKHQKMKVDFMSGLQDKKAKQIADAKMKHKIDVQKARDKFEADIKADVEERTKEISNVKENVMNSMTPPD